MRRTIITIVTSYINIQCNCTSSFQDWYDHVKSFSEQRDYDGLVVLVSSTAKHRPPDQQVAVFSNDTDILNQVLTSADYSVARVKDSVFSLMIYLPFPRHILLFFHIQPF